MALRAQWIDQRRGRKRDRFLRQKSGRLAPREAERRPHVASSAGSQARRMDGRSALNSARSARRASESALATSNALRSARFQGVSAKKDRGRTWLHLSPTAAPVSMRGGGTSASRRAQTSRFPANANGTVQLHSIQSSTCVAVPTARPGLRCPPTLQHSMRASPPKSCKLPEHSHTLFTCSAGAYRSDASAAVDETDATSMTPFLAILPCWERGAQPIRNRPWKDAVVTHSPLDCRMRCCPDEAPGSAEASSCG